MKKYMSLIFLAIGLVACASQSPYKEASKRGYGYHETQLAEQRYRVVFKARGDNSALAMDYALLRASELALEKGYDWFEVVDRQTEIIRNHPDNGSQVSAARTQRTGTSSCGLLFCSENPGTRSSEYGMRLDFGDKRNKVIAQVEIWMDKGVRPDSRNAYSARELRDNVRNNVE